MSELVTLPPHDVAAEEAVIAGLLLADGALLDVLPLLDPADFFRQQNGWVYEASIQLAERGETISVPAVAHELDREGRLDPIGGEPYLQEIAGKYFTAIGIETHARIVARDAGHRRLMTASSQVARLAHAGGPDFDAVLAEARRLIDEAEGPNRSGSIVSIADAVRELDAADDARRVTSGYSSIDRVTGGLAMGQISVVGARTDQGKTALLCGMAVRQALAGVPVAYLPLEDSRAEIVVRMADHLNGVSMSYATRHQASAALESWEDAKDRLAQLPIAVPEEGRTPADVEALCSAVVAASRAHGARVVYLDHIDALPTRSGAGQRDSAIIAEWMRRLKALAIRLGVHLVIASQVNREADQDGQTPPRMHRLKESGAKEQAAQTVLMVGLETPELDADPERETEVLAAYVEKLKGYPGGRWVVAGEGYAALYHDRRAGAIYEHGIDDRPAPRPEQAELEVVR